jgi:hypothetical protein
MKHVTYANKSLLMDDDAADLLAEYAAVLGTNDQADAVHVRAIGSDGNEVDATIVLNSSSDLVIESTNSSAEAPDNDAAVAYMRDAVLRISSPPNVQPHTDADSLEERRFADGI